MTTQTEKYVIKSGPSYLKGWDEGQPLMTTDENEAKRMIHPEAVKYYLMLRRSGLDCQIIDEVILTRPKVKTKSDAVELLARFLCERMMDNPDFWWSEHEGESEDILKFIDAHIISLGELEE